MKLGVTVLCKEEEGKAGAEDLGTAAPVTLGEDVEEVGVFTRWWKGAAADAASGGFVRDG